MGSARPSVTKRQREQLKRERKIRKAERRAERKNGEPQTDEVESQPEEVESPRAEGVQAPEPWRKRQPAGGNPSTAFARNASSQRWCPRDIRPGMSKPP